MAVRSAERGIGSAPGVSGAKVTNIWKRSVTFDAGTISAATTGEVTTTVTGLATTDRVLVTPNGALPAGVALCAGRVSAANTLSLRFANPTAGGVAVGSQAYNIVVFS